MSAILVNKTTRMLPRKNRIPRHDFPAGPRQGSRVFSTLFSGIIYPSKTGTRISVVVSKKTTKTAVARNRLRRRFYAVTTPYLQSFSQGSLVVLYPKIEAEKAPASLLKTEVETVLRRAKLIP